MAPRDCSDRLETPAASAPGDVKYALDGDRLVISPMNCDVVEEAIRNGTLKGEIRGFGFFPYKTVRMTDSTENLRRFILNADDAALFSQDSAVFTRVQ